ncbi:MAG TPA: BON domain-containing protein [Vicinamibacterales bacterium]|nr:BON domain-containing protein [Vicinamibacterales bacterium]
MKAAWNLIGVVAVLTAVAMPLSAQETIKEGVKATKDVVVKDTKTAAERTKDGVSKTGEVITDGWITSRIHERFVGETLLKHSDISVDTDKHVVTLTGTVVSAAGRRKATSIAKGTEGVHAVVNHLTIGPKKD